MRLLAFTDPHGRPEVFEAVRRAVREEEPDLVVCAGDLTVFEHGMRAHLRTVDSWGVPVLMLHGNHEDEEEMRAACASLENVIFLHKALAEVGGYRFLAYGGGGFQDEYPEFEALLEKPPVRKLPWRKVVVLSHAPPYGTLLDNVGGAEEWHVGSATLRRLVEEREPLAVIAGHIHDCFGARQRLGRTFMINPGPSPVLLDLEALP